MKKRNPMARTLAQGQFQNKVIKSKKVYKRKKLSVTETANTAPN
jgi:hypothetical protein